MSTGTPPLTIIDLQQETLAIEAYKNTPLSLVNDHIVRLSIMTEPYYWHYHPTSDEIFLVTEGILCIDLEERTVQLAPGQLFTIPANVRHRTRPLGSRSVNLTFELADMETIKIEPPR
jgi:mannose-6-phosphate isomerase-like protein (cupin superfamily)